MEKEQEASKLNSKLSDDDSYYDEEGDSEEDYDVGMGYDDDEVVDLTEFTEEDV